MLGIRYYRQQRRVSQDKLGYLASTTQATVSLIERGFLRPDDELLDRIAAVLGVSPAFLLLRDVDPQEERSA